MRMRKLFAATLLALVAVLMAPTVASAQESGSETEPKFADKAAEHCAELLEGGSKVDECQESPSPILPEKNELIWGLISFVVVLALLSKFAWPGLKKGLQDRAERIRSDLDSAESAKQDADRILDEYKAQLADARNEAARIIEESRQAADALRRDQEQRLQTELAQMRERAAADIESAKRQAVADLRDEVAQLAIGAAEVIVQRNLDRDTQVRLVESYIEQVASRSN